MLNYMTIPYILLQDIVSYNSFSFFSLAGGAITSRMKSQEIVLYESRYIAEVKLRNISRHMSVHALRLHVTYILVIKLFSQVRKHFFSPEQIWHGQESISGLSVEMTDVHEEFFL